MIEFDCPLCGARLHARVHFLGRLEQCRSCEQSVEVPRQNMVSEADILDWISPEPSSTADDRNQKRPNEKASNRLRDSSNDPVDNDWASILRDVEITHQNSTRQRYLSPIPNGYQIYVPATAVAGSQFSRHQIERLFEFRRPRIAFEPEPTNSHDPNAIKVIACNGDSHSWIHVGYVPAKLAKKVAKSGLAGQLHPRLRMVQVGDFIEVEFDLCGPKSNKAAFHG